MKNLKKKSIFLSIFLFISTLLWSIEPTSDFHYRWYTDNSGPSYQYYYNESSYLDKTDRYKAYIYKSDSNMYYFFQYNQKQSESDIKFFLSKEQSTFKDWKKQIDSAGWNTKLHFVFLNPDGSLILQAEYVRQ